MSTRGHFHPKFIIGLVGFSIVILIFTKSEMPLARYELLIQNMKEEETAYRIKGPLENDDSRLLSYVRQLYLSPPSTKPYNLSAGVDVTYKNGSTMGTYIYIDEHLKELYSDAGPGFFVEAGALDGQFLSNTLWLEQARGWTGLLVEPDKRSFQALEIRHRRAWSSNTCLSNKPYPKETIHVSWHPRDIGDIPWIYHGNAHELGVAGQVTHVDFSNLSGRSYSVVQCFPLSTLLNAMNVTTVDFLSLDVQGSEKDILRNFAWDKIKIRFMVMESNEYEIDEDFVRYVEEKGYYLVNREVAPAIFDYLYVRKDEDVLLKKIVQFYMKKGYDTSFYKRSK